MREGWHYARCKVKMSSRRAGLSSGQLFNTGLQDTLLEEIVAPLSFESDISSISWEIVGNEEH